MLTVSDSFDKKDYFLFLLFLASREKSGKEKVHISTKHGCVLACLHACVLTCLGAYVLVCLRARVFTCSRAHVLTCLRARVLMRLLLVC